MTTAIKPAMERRAYQDQSVLDILEAIEVGKNPLYVLPTGAGKTIIAARVSQALIQYGKRIHFWVHRTELVDQAMDTLSKALPWEEIGQVRRGKFMIPDAMVNVAMVRTLVNRIKQNDIARPDVVFIDEAHHARASTWEALLSWCPDASFVGLTATPARLDGKGLHEHFDTLIQGISDSKLVDLRFLAPVDTLAPNPMEVLAARRNRETVTVANSVKAYQAHAVGQSSIFFGWNIQHSRDTAAAFNAAGIRAVHVDGNTPPEARESAMTRLRSSDIDIVCNHNIISEGFDAPDVSCIILGAPTDSIVRYLQWCGRGRRPGDGKRTMILDLAGIAHYFGEPNVDREWTLDDGVIRPNHGVITLRPEDSMRDHRKPLEVVDWDLRSVGEWNSLTRLLPTKHAAEIIGINPKSMYSRHLRELGIPDPKYKAPRGGAPSLFCEYELTEFAKKIPKIIKREEISKILGIARATLENRITRGEFPRPTIRNPHNGRERVWKRKEFFDWFASQDLSVDQVCERFKLSKLQLDNRIRKGNFPKCDSSAYGLSRRAWSLGIIIRHEKHIQSIREAVSMREIGTVMGVSVVSIQRMLKKKSFPTPDIPRGNGSIDHRWFQRTCRNWITDNMPDRLPALDAFLEERKSTHQSQTEERT